VIKQTLAATAAIAMAMTSIGCEERTPEAVPNKAVVQADLQTLARARILFAHQSVGRNILDGVQALARDVGVPVRIVQISDLPPDGGPGLFHGHVGTNGDPDSKIDAFGALLSRSERPQYDVAVLKFCYEDMARDAKQADGLVDRYLERIGTLRSSRPDIQIVHVTMPLRADPLGWKTTIKRWLGRSTWEDADNLRRNAYNQQLRTRLGDAPVFDLATTQSTLPDGSRSGFATAGGTVFTLAQAYTNDGGHLNPFASQRAAAEFVHALALAIRKPTAPGQ
jgi:hypothetical protein